MCAPTKLSTWIVLRLQAQDDRHVTDSAQAVVAFFRHVVAPEDWVRFEQAAEQADDPDLHAAIHEVLGGYTGRPTRRSSGSPDGPSSTGPSSTDGSSPREGTAPAVRSLHAPTAGAGIPTGRPVGRPTVASDSQPGSAQAS